MTHEARSLRVALVGPDYQENLGLEYLAAAAERAGHSVSLVAYGSCRDLGRALSEVWGLGADLVGLSIAFQSCLSDYLLFAEALRQQGFAGHLTAGGHVPSFEYTGLLRDCSALDTIVRHDGEATLVELLGCLARGVEPRDLDGLVWRQGSTVEVGPARRPPADLDQLAPPRRAKALRRFAGLPMGFVITSRGCTGECAYCCIRALAHDAGGAALRLRHEAAVARELSELFRAGAKVVFLQDDLFILPHPSRAIDRIQALARSLAELGVRERAFWVKGRPDSISPALLRAARELGIIHIFLGIENHSPARLRYLGRRHQPADNEHALALLAEHGLGVSFNLMLFDPDCTLEDVAINLDFAARHLDVPWNICRTELYSGTELLARVAAERRLSGDYRSYGYVMRDLRAELMFRILRVAFRQRAFQATSLLNHAVSLGFAYELYQRVLPGRASDELAAAVRTLGTEIRQDTVDSLRQVLDYSASADPLDHAGTQRFAVELGFSVNQRDLGWRKRVAEWLQILDARGAQAAVAK